jgi:hypothetical protein
MSILVRLRLQVAAIMEYFFAAAMVQLVEGSANNTSVRELPLLRD